MRARTGIAVGILAIACGWLGSASADEAKAEQAAPKTILFLGDSITRGGGYVRTIEAELAKQSPNSFRVINHGRSSETVSNLSEAYHPGRRPCVLTRIDDELKQTKPDWVVACYGINDGIYHPFNEKRFAAYQEGMEALIKKVHESGARVILLTAPPYARTGSFPEGADAAARDAIVAEANAKAEAEAEKDPNKFGYKTPYAYYDEVMARYAKWLLTLNGRKDVWVVDLREPMLPKIKQTHGRDPIHPNGTGHAIMAEAFLKQWGTIQGQPQGAVPQLAPIFNGQDLSGFRAPEPNKWWTVEEGILVGVNDPAKQGSVLWTEQNYQDVMVEVEFRFTGEVDSGVLLRKPEIQAQIGVSRSLKKDMTGSIYAHGKYPKQAQVDKLLKVGEWNTLRFQAKGSTYDVWLNGEHVLNFEDKAFPNPAPIGLQIHGGLAMKIEFRSLKAAALNEVPATATWSGEKIPKKARKESKK